MVCVIVRLYRVPNVGCTAVKVLRVVILGVDSVVGSIHRVSNNCKETETNQSIHVNRSCTVDEIHAFSRVIVRSIVDMCQHIQAIVVSRELLTEELRCRSLYMFVLIVRNIRHHLVVLQSTHYLDVHQQTCRYATVFTYLSGRPLLGHRYSLG